MLTAAIIGCGRVVQVGHLLGFKEVRDRIRVVAVADPVRENRDVVGEALDIPEHFRFADYGDLLKEVEFDFADQALPHFLHEEAIIVCAERSSRPYRKASDDECGERQSNRLGRQKGGHQVWYTAQLPARSETVCDLHGHPGG